MTATEQTYSPVPERSQPIQLRAGRTAGRSATLRSCLVIISLFFVVGASRAEAGEGRPPNIVFILTDDLGINDLGCYGRRDHRTPNLDRLAAEGMRFGAAYCAQPICSPSRAAILTGKAPARLHLTTYLPGRADCPAQKLLHPAMLQQLPLEARTLPELLQPAGYVSACIGKWHLGGQGFLPADQGFDVYHPGQANTKPSETEGGKGEYDLTARAEEFLPEPQPTVLSLPRAQHPAYSVRGEDKSGGGQRRRIRSSLRRRDRNTG